MKSKSTDPWKRLDSLLKITPEPTDGEWFKVQDFADKYKLSHSTAIIRLRKLVKNNILEEWGGKLTSSKRFGYKYRIKP